MTNKEAREVLLQIRPERPRATEARRLQQAIDVALTTMENYEKVIESLSVEVRGVQK